MLSSRFFALLVATSLLVTAAFAGKKGKGRKGGGKLDTDGFKDLQDEVEELAEKVKMLEEAKGMHEGHAEGSQVHLYFHGDGAGHATHSDADVVDVHVKMDGGHQDAMGHVHEAHCEFEPVDASSGIVGHVHIVEEHADNHAHFHVHFDHLADDQHDYELHVHENGDKSKGCESFGGHFTSPSGVSGDIGSVTPEADGTVHEWFNDTQIAVVGHNGIIGRGIVIHDEDGAAMACCVIGYSAEMDQAGHHVHGHGHHGHGMPKIEHFEA